MISVLFYGYIVTQPTLFIDVHTYLVQSIKCEEFHCTLAQNNFFTYLSVLHSHKVLMK